MVFICKATSGPTQYRHLELFEGVEHIRTVALRVRNFAVRSYPQSSVDTGTEVLSELSVDFFVDLIFALVSMDSDYGVLGRSIERECCGEEYNR